jgi:acetoin utilization protein AcuB
MLVRERMTRHPVTVSPDTPINQALDLMRREKVRRLPVLDRRGQLVGIVLEKDLLYASPSPATSLSIYEMHYLLSQLTVDEVMTREVITVDELTPLEEAARIMADNRVSGLPVMRGEQLVGIVTETDLFKVFLEMLGARERGLRLTIQVPDEQGMLASITGAIAALGGDIVSLSTFWGEDLTAGVITIKVRDLTTTRRQLVEAMEGLGLGVVDIRQI